LFASSAAYFIRHVFIASLCRPALAEEREWEERIKYESEKGMENFWKIFWMKGEKWRERKQEN
jgi:hypothetical protein